MNAFFLTNWELMAGFVCGLLLAGLLVALVVWWKRGAAIRSGKRGERAVAKELSHLRKREYIVLNDLMLPTTQGHTSQIDHVVVSTRGIFVIETKNHAGRIVGTEQGQYWQQHLPTQSRGFYNPILQNRSHLRAIRRHLPKKLDPDLFSTMVVFTQAWRLDIKADEVVRQRSLLPDKRIQRTLNPAERTGRQWLTPWRKRVVLDEHKMVTKIDDMLAEIKRRPRIMDRSSMKAIASKLQEVNITDHAIRKLHNDYVKHTATDIASEIKKGKCPRCGSKLIVRKSDKGEFVGCSSYPRCRFTCSIDCLHS